MHIQFINGNISPIHLAALIMLVSTSLHSWAEEVRAEEAPSILTEENLLPEVQVSASHNRSNASEGTDAYIVEEASTATGLDLSIRDTPQSVTVITRERMDDQAMDTVGDALRSATGVSITPVDRVRSQISVRGFEVSSFQFDGVPVANGNNVNHDLASTAIYDRVEIVRGSTGLLNGAGEPSAAINLVRKHADSKVFTGTVSAKAGSWDEYGTTADVTTPLNQDGSIRGRFVASVTKQHYFVDLENSNQTVLYGVVDADITLNTQLSVGISDQREKRDDVLWAPLPLWYSDGTRTDWRRSKTTAARWNEWDTQEKTWFASLKHIFDNNWSVQADFSHNENEDKEKLLWLWDGSAPDRNTGLGIDATAYRWTNSLEQNQFSVMAKGPFSMLGREHELVVGALHSKHQGRWTVWDSLAGTTSAGNFNTWDGYYPEPGWGTKYLGEKATTKQTAVYGATRLHLTDALKLITGARVTNWSWDTQPAVWVPQGYEVEQNHIVTPYAGLMYDLNEQLSVYGSYAEIYKPQTGVRDRSGDYLDPLEGKTYELGLKAEFMGGKLQASSAVFYIDQDNFAVEDTGHFVLDDISLGQAYTAAQGSTSKGYELELVGELTPRWDISAGWTHFWAKAADGSDIAVDAPRRMLKVSTKYRLTGNWQGFSVGGSANWQSKQLRRFTNPVTGEEERTGQSAYGLVDMMAGYDLNKNLSLQLNVYNVFDKKYKSSSFWNGFNYGEPRSALLTMDYKF